MNTWTSLKNEQLISENMTIAKVLSILVVAASHFFSGYLLWIPATVGLFIFGFSSGYFTSLKYSEGFQRKPFWVNKLSRLGVNLLVINIFLLCLFLYQGAPGIFSLKSLVNVLGLTGILNWLALDNPGPFGSGLWFFTLLLIFYLVYPVLNRLRWLKEGSVFPWIPIVYLLFFLNHYIYLRHMLWSTALSFLVGCRMAQLQRVPALGISFVAVCVLVIGMVVANVFFEFRLLNFFFIVGLSFFTVMVIFGSPLIGKVLSPFALLSGCLLEIYFIHTYVMIRPSGNSIVDYFVSMILAIGIAYGLYRISELLKTKVFLKNPV